MINNLSIFISLVSFVAAAIGGWLALRSTIGKQGSTIQAQTIGALSARVSALESERENLLDDIERFKDDLAKSKQLISAIKRAFEKQGIVIEVDNDYISIIDISGKKSTQIPFRAMN